MLALLRNTYSPGMAAVFWTHGGKLLAHLFQVVFHVEMALQMWKGATLDAVLFIGPNAMPWRSSVVYYKELVRESLNLYIDSSVRARKSPNGVPFKANLAEEIKYGCNHLLLQLAVVKLPTK